MNRLKLTTITLGLIIFTACNKQLSTNQKELPADGSANNKATTLAACQPEMYNLAVDSITGFSYIYKVTGSPSATPISVAPYVISVDNQLKTCSGQPINYATGLAYDPATGKFYGTTGAAGSPANHILEFTDPNCVTVTPATSTCGITLDLSDVERDPATNTFYAINRGTAPNHRIVTIGLPGSTVSCLPNTIPVGIHMRGLTFDCNGKLHVMHTGGGSIGAILVPVDKTTGSNGTPFGYIGPVVPSAAVSEPEIGLHFDCCIGKFITGNYNPYMLPTLMTDYKTGVYKNTRGVLKPTVDFARPY